MVAKLLQRYRTTGNIPAKTPQEWVKTAPRPAYDHRIWAYVYRRPALLQMRTKTRQELGVPFVGLATFCGTFDSAYHLCNPGSLFLKS